MSPNLLVNCQLPTDSISSERYAVVYNTAINSSSAAVAELSTWKSYDSGISERDNDLSAHFGRAGWEPETFDVI